MKKQLINSHLLLAVIVLIAGFVMFMMTFNITAYADANADIINQCAGKDSSFCEGYTKTGSPVSKYISIAVDVLSWLAGIIAVAMLMYGGFLYITSSGNAEKAKNGRNTVIYSLAGVAVVVLARFLVLFIIGKLN